MIWRWLHRHPRLVDVSLVGFLLVVGVGAAVHSGHPPGVAVGLAFAETLPLLARRRFPLAVALILTAVAIPMIALDVWLIPLPLGVALYTVGAARADLRDLAAPALLVIPVAIAAVSSRGLEFGAAAARVVFL